MPNWRVTRCDGMAEHTNCEIREASTVRKLQALIDANLVASPNEAGCCATGRANLPRHTLFRPYEVI